jgi:hypothetical protein
MRFLLAASVFFSRRLGAERFFFPAACAGAALLFGIALSPVK